jgi:ankyrin repeat protein
VNPVAAINDAVRFASANGHLAVVELLLAEERIDPTSLNNDAIRGSSKNGHLEVVRLLLADERVDPAAEENAAILAACQFGHLDVVEVLLADKRVDPAASDDIAIRKASEGGHGEVVRLLLSDERVDPAADDNFVLLSASRVGSKNILCLLLEHPAVVVTKSALIAADAEGHAGIVLLLLSKQPQVLSQLCRGEVTCVAAGPLTQELKQWEARSALMLLLALKRTQSSQAAARVSDVLRDVSELYSRFHEGVMIDDVVRTEVQRK